MNQGTSCFQIASLSTVTKDLFSDGVAEVPSMQRWRKGKVIPSTKCLLAMKKVFGVEVEDLID